MSVRVLHLADVHLGRPLTYLGDAAPSRRQDLVDTFARICSLALQREVGLVLIAGDVFDSYNPPEALAQTVGIQLARLVEAGITVIVVPGDHDSIWYERSVWRKHAFPGIFLVQNATFDGLIRQQIGGINVAIHGVAYNPMICDDPLVTLRREAGAVNLAVLHASVDPPASLAAEQRFFPVSRLELFHTGMDYVALGHLHNRQTYVHAGRIIAAYSGTPEGLDPAETGPRYVTLLHFDGGPPEVEFVQVNARDVRTERFNVTGLGEADVIRQLQNLGREDILLSARLAGYPLEVLNVERIWDEVRRSFFWIGIEDQTRISSSDLVERMATETTISGRFVRTLRRRIAAAEDVEERDLIEYALKFGLRSLLDRHAS